jgi:hypothetical protein
MKKEKGLENGVEAETWYPRLTAFHSINAKALMPTDFPRSLRFVGGKLAEIGEKGSPEPLAKFPEDFLQQASKMVKQKLYLRIDVPHRYHPQVDAAVEVSPEGVLLPSTTSTITDNLWWNQLPNASVTPDKVLQSGGALEIRNRAVRSKFAVLFVGIKTMEDFKAAFDRTFSATPLQDAHPEWPAEVRKAVAGRYAIEGMTAEQTHCVTGVPISVEKREENGAKVEVWRLREKARVLRGPQGKGGATNLESLRFVDGKLVLAVPPSGKPSG